MARSKDIIVCRYCKGFGVYRKEGRDETTQEKATQYNKCLMCDGSGRLLRIITLIPFKRNYQTEKN